MIKIAVFDTKSYDMPGFEKYGKEHGIAYKFYETKLNADTVGLAAGYEGVCAFVNDTLCEKVVNGLSDLGVKLIALRSAGFNNVDMKAAQDKISIVRVPAYSPYAVAEHAMALLLTSVRRTHKAYNRTREFNFSLNGLTGFDLYGKTVGVVGTGKIGRVFIDICRGFGMNVIAYDLYPAKDSGIEYVTLDELFSRSDIISLHCPLTHDSMHMINKKSIEKMKKGVFILNTSRGALINADDLIAGIKSKKIGAACLDVYEEEADFFYEDFSGHIIQDDTLVRLIALPNVIITSHQAFLTNEALNNIAETTTKNIAEFFGGKKLTNEVCFRCDNK